MSKTKFHLSALLMASLVTLAPSSSFAQEDDRELMQNQLSEFQKEFEDYPKELKKHFGSLANTQTETFIVELEAGKEYAFAGTCGNACADFDLVLTDDERFEVEVDAQPTDLPLIIFTSEKTGLYSLRSKMIRCYDDTCPFAVGVYSN